MLRSVSQLLRSGRQLYGSMGGEHSLQPGTSFAAIRHNPLFEQRVHKFFRIEGQQVSGFFAHANIANR
jgi:hypothetical protein